MDYKELIGRLKKYAEFGGRIEICADSLTAIETLLAERDAAVEDLRGMCWCCAHGKKYENGLSWSRATTCEHMRELGVVARSGGKCKCSHWEWRGPGGVGDGDTPGADENVVVILHVEATDRRISLYPLEYCADQKPGDRTKRDRMGAVQ